MADLIDRQALLRDIEKYHLSDGKFQHWVEVQPSVEAEPVRYGHWYIQRFGSDAKCSECGMNFTDAYDIENHDKYCRHCGARMLGIAVKEWK